MSYNVEHRIEEYLMALRREGMDFCGYDLEYADQFKVVQEYIMDLLIDLGVMRELDNLRYGVQQSLF